jgi:8-oxo-dGTP diphosphatase
MSDEPRPPATTHHPPASFAERRINVAAAVVMRDGLLLLTQRPPGDPLALQWELPGGKVEPGETPAHALVREIREELGVAATPGEVLEVDTHDYPHGLEVEVVFVSCTLETLVFTPSRAVHAVRWVAPQAIDLTEVLAGDRGFLARLAAGAIELGRRPSGAGEGC